MHEPGKVVCKCSTTVEDACLKVYLAICVNVLCTWAEQSVPDFGASNRPSLSAIY